MITVAMICHNERDKISSCIESLFKQTQEFTELIVIDNHPAGETIQWIEEHYKSDKLLLIQASENNLGLSRSRAV